MILFDDYFRVHISDDYYELHKKLNTSRAHATLFSLSLSFSLSFLLFQNAYASFTKKYALETPPSLPPPPPKISSTTT